MHPSRMRTVRYPGWCLTRVVSDQGGVCLGVSAWRVSARVGVCPGGGCLLTGVVHLPPVDRMTGVCENITFPQLLNIAVNIGILVL